jgi:Zn ribbon nucleic-acid-binding protein
MGDKTWHYEDCPQCHKETLECFEQFTALLKHKECNNCGYIKAYELEERDGVIKVKGYKVTYGKGEGSVDGSVYG